MEVNFQGLSLVDEEEDGGVFNNEEDAGQEQTDLSLCLIGRFLTDRIIRLKAMKEVLPGVWRLGRGVNITETEKGLFLFQFFHQVDLERVEGGGPWSFDGHLLVLSRVHMGVTLTSIPLFHVAFWIQIHNLPLGFMFVAVGMYLGNYIGQFLEYDKNNNNMLWRRYMRIRVLVDVRIPLKRSRKVTLQGGDWNVVNFRYERLGTFCFRCGLIGNIDSFCDLRFIVAVDDGVRGWGAELRADTRRQTGGGTTSRPTDEGTRVSEDRSGGAGNHGIPSANNPGDY